MSVPSWSFWSQLHWLYPRCVWFGFQRIFQDLWIFNSIARENHKKQRFKQWSNMMFSPSQRRFFFSKPYCSKEMVTPCFQVLVNGNKLAGNTESFYNISGFQWVFKKYQQVGSTSFLGNWNLVLADFDSKTPRFCMTPSALDGSLMAPQMVFFFFLFYIFLFIIFIAQFFDVVWCFVVIILSVFRCIQLFLEVLVFVSMTFWQTFPGAYFPGQLLNTVPYAPTVRRGLEVWPKASLGCHRCL